MSELEGGDPGGRGPLCYEVSKLRVRPRCVQCFALIIVGMFAVGVLGLAKAEDQPVEFIQLFVWHDGPARELRPIHHLLGLYHQVYPETRIVLNVHPTTEAYRQLEAWDTSERRTAPDMVILPATWLPEFGHLVRSLQAALTVEQRAVFHPGLLDMLTADGRLRAVPWLVGGRGLVVRADLLGAAGLAPPQTWDEVLAVAEALHNPPGVYGIGLPGSAGGGELLAEITWGWGGRLCDDEGQLMLSTAASAEALDLFGQLVRFAQPEVLSWSQKELEGLFLDGKLAMLVTDSWWAQEVASDPELDLAVQMVALPRQSQPVAHLIAEGLAVLQNSAYEKQCVEFVRMVCETQSQAQLLKLGGLPTGPDLADACRADPLRASLTATLDHVRSIPVQDREKVLEALRVAIYLSLSGRMAPAEALQQAEDILLGSPQADIAS